MKFVIQPSSQEGGGIATLAMLANKSSSEMEKEMKLKELVLKNNFVTVNQMVLVLKDLMKVDYIQLR